MPKKHKRLTSHPKLTPELLKKAEESRRKNDEYYLSPEGQAEMSQWKAQSESRKHGGARIGAGRKPVSAPKVTLSLRVTSEVKRFLESAENASEVTEQTIRRSTAFRQWQQQNKTGIAD